MSKVYRIYVEKKEGFRVAADNLLDDLSKYLKISGLEDVRVLVRYDIENIDEDILGQAKETIFSEPPVDYLYEETFEKNEGDIVFSVEYLPGQFDQREDAAVQCVKLLKEDENPTIHVATTYVLSGDLSKEDFEKIIDYCINPVDSRITKEDKPHSIEYKSGEPEDVEILDGFINMEAERIDKLYLWFCILQKI